MSRPSLTYRELLQLEDEARQQLAATQLRLRAYEVLRCLLYEPLHSWRQDQDETWCGNCGTRFAENPGPCYPKADGPVGGGPYR